MMKLIRLLACISLLFFFAAPANATYMWLGGADIWDDPANWDCFCIPGPGDEVLITSGAVDLAGLAITVDIVSLKGGAIIDGGGGSLKTTGGFGWTGGTIFSVVIISGSSLDMSGAGTKTLKGELYIEGGSLAGWSAGAFHIDGGGLFNSGTFVIESDADITEGVFLGMIENDGIFAKTAGTGITDVGAFFYNFGLGEIEVNTGTLSMNAGLKNEATIKVDPGTILDVTYDGIFDTGSALDGTGKIKFSGDTSRYNVYYDGTVEMEFSGTTVMIIEDIVLTTGSILIDGAKMEGAGVLTALGAATWEAGRIMTDFTLKIDPAGSLTISSIGIKRVYGTLDLDGATSWTSGSIDMYSGSEIEIASIFETDFDGTINSSTVGGGEIIIGIGGTFEKTAGGGITRVEPNVTNYGSIKASSDTIDLIDVFLNHWIAHSAAGANLSFFGGSTWSSGSDMTGTGDMDFNDNDNTFSSAITCSNQVGFFGGTTTLNTDLTNDNVIDLHSPAVLKGVGELICEDLFNFKGGSIQADVTIKSGADFDIYSAESKFLSSAVVINGTGTLFTTATDFNLDAPGTITNNGTFKLGDGADIMNSGSSGTFSNSGVLSKSDGGTSNLDVSFSNNSSGTIRGIGTLKPTVSFTNNGIVEPGNSPGILTIDDDFVNGKQINIEVLDGMGAGTGHDQLIITGTATLEDTLMVTETGIVPDGTYTILTCTGGPSCISGTFEKVTLPANYTITYNATEVTLTKNSVLPVDLLYFNAKANGNDVVIDWGTASELNNDFFQIERSFDGRDFMAIGVVGGVGNSTINQAYFFKDEGILKDNFFNTIYYRLKQIDLDGHFEYSKIAALDLTPLEEAWTINVIADSDGRIQVVYNSQVDKKIQLAIFDLSGKLIFRKDIEIQKGTGNLDLFMHSVSSGIYLVQMAAGKFQQTQKINIVNRN